MDAEQRPLLPELAAALAGWQRRRRLTDLVPPLLDWCLPRFQAERALLFTDRVDDGYHVWGSRTIDGETIAQAEKSIAHFAVMRAEGSDTPTLFHDTRSDRRFRTEAERDHGVRSRSILLIPLPGTDPRTSIYLDSRFRVIDEPREDDLEWQTVRDLFALALTQYSDRRGRLDAERKLKRREKALESRETRAPSEAAKRLRPARPAVDPVEFHGFLTRNAALIESLDELRRLAPSDVPVLIEGESGTGKELLARAVHTASGREGRFVTLHCGTIPETLVEVELFGHLEGAFTGADRAREGLLAHARAGTVFLDAVEEASPTLQGALLRVLETGKYRPLASEEEIESDVRIISAVLEAPDTDANAASGGRLESEIRTDLYYRLAGARVFLPPLRERREDIEPLLARLFSRAAGKNATPLYGEGVKEALIAHDWPGNAREMENLARRLVALGEPTLTEIRFREITGVERVAPRVDGEMRHVVERAEREVILRALHEAGGNKSVACQLLGWSRRTLYRRMQKHGIPL